MSEGIAMSDGTVVAGANSFSPDWVRSELRCTKASLRGQPTVLDLTLVVHNNEANFSKVGLSERAVGVAPLAAARGDADTSMLKAMEEASAASAAERARAGRGANTSRGGAGAGQQGQRHPRAAAGEPRGRYPSPAARERKAAGSELLAATTATQSGGASKTGAPTAAQRAHAAEVKQRQENKKLVELVQSSTRERLDPVLEVMRDVDGIFPWYDLVTSLESAMEMAMDFNLLDARKGLSDTLSRGGRVVAACSNPRTVLGVLSKMLPFVQGVSQDVHEADCADLCKIHALTMNHLTSPDGTGLVGQALTGFGGQAGTGFGGLVTPAEAMARRKQAQSMTAGAKSGSAFPIAHTDANIMRGAYQGRGDAVPGYYGSLPAHSGGGRRRCGGSSGSSNVGGETAGLSPAEFAAFRANRAAHHSAAQAQQRNSPGNLQEGDTCRKCLRTRRDQHHSHLTYAWQICMRCNAAGHRRAACTGAFGPEV
eukprot:jgi/Undpi1/1220/HiC_scaffold_108.g14134.m1